MRPGGAAWLALRAAGGRQLRQPLGAKFQAAPAAVAAEPGKFAGIHVQPYQLAGLVPGHRIAFLQAQAAHDPAVDGVDLFISARADPGPQMGTALADVIGAQNCLYRRVSGSSETVSDASQIDDEVWRVSLSPKAVNAQKVMGS